MPLLAWLLATTILLYRQQPLFKHHLSALDAPLIALALLGLADPAAYKAVLTRFTTIGSKGASAITFGAVLLLLVTAAVNVQQEIGYYRNNDALNASQLVQQNVQVANDLRQAITPDQWVITDGQFIAGLADRSTPPGLVDTSSVRLATGYVTLAQLEQAALNPRVHAILFYTNRFSRMYQAAAFHTWVAAHFHLAHRYSQSQELWVR